jgi:opacity protein-like surface antigen
MGQSYLLAGAGGSTNHVDFTEYHDRDREFDARSFRDRGSSAVVSIGIGAPVQRSLRGEIVLSYRPEYASKVNPDPGIFATGARSRLQSLSTLASLYYDFQIPSRFKPYVGAGVGLAHNRMRVDSIPLSSAGTLGARTESSNHFAWQLGGGVAYEIGPAVSLDLGYRYFDGGSVGFNQTLHAQEVQLGIRAHIG